MIDNNSNHEGLNFIRIFIKVALILAIIDFAWILIPDNFPGDISVYNSIVAGRERLPFGENPENSYNLSIFNINAMFSSHKISGAYNDDSFRVFIVGDSSIWGFLQRPEESLAGMLEDRFGSQRIDVYNVGYPSISILKDALLIDHAMRYDPDLIIWFTTLEALPTETQLSIPINANNPRRIQSLIQRYGFEGLIMQPQSIIQRTFWNQRRNLLDVIRLQMYGFLWDATGIDQEYPDSSREAQRDFPDPILQYHEIGETQKIGDYLSMDIIRRVISENSDTDFVLVNEPILISEGENSHIQYNFYYPKWAYDSYREIINKFAEINSIKYYDLWNIVPEQEFTNSAIHLTVEGERILAGEVYQIITEYIGE